MVTSPLIVSRLSLVLAVLVTHASGKNLIVSESSFEFSTFEFNPHG